MLTLDEIKVQLNQLGKTLGYIEGTNIKELPNLFSEDERIKKVIKKVWVHFKKKNSGFLMATNECLYFITSDGTFFNSIRRYPYEEIIICKYDITGHDGELSIFTDGEEIVFHTYYVEDGQKFYDYIHPRIDCTDDELDFLVLDYLGGYPGFNNEKVCISPGDKKNYLKFDKKAMRIRGLLWEEKGERSLGKAATGAIIGDVITGGIGMIAGAAIGGRKKDVSTAIITIEEQEMQYTLYFRCTQQEFKKLSQFLNSPYINIPSTSNTCNNMVEQIKRLAKEQGNYYRRK